MVITRTHITSVDIDMDNLLFDLLCDLHTNLTYYEELEDLKMDDPIFDMVAKELAKKILKTS